ncbi:hypothetical protein EHQ58_03740 [Leptospira ognonensis]|uniref:Uncharacterized protein n=1 Tax=Leptospira ognonensis TaxID=2484945 RepID=A0A4R9K7M1_9LEPT|nr:hypothetical protein [Leptospira ognonensis]TGL62319.1 hypothetical protein EHQ58_03740 [Leptospira ognonensis]
MALYKQNWEPPEKAIGARLAVIFVSIILYTGDPSGLKNFLSRKSELKSTDPKAKKAYIQNIINIALSTIKTKANRAS